MNKLYKMINTQGWVEVQLPNEIFEDYSKASFKNYQHKCFAYGYYYLVSYLYRNAVYGEVENPESLGLKGLSEVFVSSYGKISYITKRGGVLDEIGYTDTTSNYPISYYMMDDTLMYSYIDELRDLNVLSHGVNFLIKTPLKSIARFDDEMYTGTYYDYQNTHLVKFDTFAKIVSDEQLGHVGLFVYGYLKMMFDKFREGYVVSNKRLSEVVGCSERVLSRITIALEEKGFIESSRTSREDGLHMWKKYFVN